MQHCVLKIPTAAPDYSEVMLSVEVGLHAAPDYSEVMLSAGGGTACSTVC